MSDCTSNYDPALVRHLVVLTQSGLPLVSDPWAWLGEQLGLTPDDTLDLLRTLQATGLIRRIAAVPNHYRLGYCHNGMTVWDVDTKHIDDLGEKLGALPFISHCYRRPRRPQWPYNLFAMIHGRSAAEINVHREEIRAVLGPACRQDEMLVSTHILKKTGLRLAQHAKENSTC